MRCETAKTAVKTMLEAAERESALRTQRQAQALLIQRKQRMSALVAKRRMNLAYLQNAHLGGTFWLNCTLLSMYDIQQYAQFSMYYTEIDNATPPGSRRRRR